MPASKFNNLPTELTRIPARFVPVISRIVDLLDQGSITDTDLDWMIDKYLSDTQSSFVAYLKESQEPIEIPKAREQKDLISRTELKNILKALIDSL